MRNILKLYSGTQSGTGVSPRKYHNFVENGGGGRIIGLAVTKNIKIKSSFFWQKTAQKIFLNNIMIYGTLLSFLRNLVYKEQDVSLSFLNYYLNKIFPYAKTQKKNN